MVIQLRKAYGGIQTAAICQGRMVSALIEIKIPSNNEDNTDKSQSLRYCTSIFVAAD